MGLQRGDRVPHFEVTTIDGSRIAYTTIWQRRNLLLVSLDGIGSRAPAGAAFVEHLAARQEELRALATAVVITKDAVPGVPCPGVVIADRWGEIYFVGGGTSGDLPPAGELLEWLAYIQQECPECEGERR